MALNGRPVRKAVLPAAGLGTRMLPATKAVPKEMLPILGKPMIQYTVDECHASGIEEVIIVTRPGKSLIENYFAADAKLEGLLEHKGQHTVAEEIRQLSRSVHVHFVRQAQPRGLGDAVLSAKPLVGREPFAVLLPDVFLLGTRAATAQLIQARAECRGSVVAVEHIPPQLISQCGIVDVDPNSLLGRKFHIRKLVEKPSLQEAPSDLGIMGRYVLEPEIFDCLEHTLPGSGDEVQLTDALTMLAQEGNLWAFVCEAKSFDAGNRNGFFQLSVELAFRDAELSPWLRRRIAEKD